MALFKSFHLTHFSCLSILLFDLFLLFSSVVLLYIFLQFVRPWSVMPSQRRNMLVRVLLHSSKIESKFVQTNTTTKLYTIIPEDNPHLWTIRTPKSASKSRKNCTTSIYAQKVSQSPKTKITHGEEESENELALVLPINEHLVCSVHIFWPLHQHTL